tara:strand:+ start:607 stop:996 length:390 start_codon:yes stop_codon:yes gene_type:complete
MKTKFETIKSNVKTIAPMRNAWARGVKDYALELLENLESNPDLINEFNEGMPIREKDLLNGASDWDAYSYGGCSSIYNEDIAERLCTPSELKKTRRGDRNPNAREDWLQCQARALGQACRLVLRAAELA